MTYNQTNMIDMTDGEIEMRQVAKQLFADSSAYNVKVFRAYMTVEFIAKKKIHHIRVCHLSTQEFFVDYMVDNTIFISETIDGIDQLASTIIDYRRSL